MAGGETYDNYLVIYYYNASRVNICLHSYDSGRVSPIRNAIEKNEIMMTVMHVVVTGEYGNCRIVSMWSSKEDAQAECERSGGYVQEYFLDVSGQNGARRELKGFYAEYNIGTVSGEVTADDVDVKPHIFKGEMEDMVYAYQDSSVLAPHVSACSMTEEKAVSLILGKLAELEKIKIGAL